MSGWYFILIIIVICMILVLVFIIMLFIMFMGFEGGVRLLFKELILFFLEGEDGIEWILVDNNLLVSVEEFIFFVSVIVLVIISVGMLLMLIVNVWFV